jgi:hypothetical protein
MRKYIVVLVFILAFLPILIFSQSTAPIYGISQGNKLVVFQGGVTVQIIYNEAAQDLFDKFSVDPPGQVKEGISQWYDTIQYYDVDDSLESRFLFALHNQNDALIDWFRPVSATLVNSPTFKKYEGFTTNGSSSYIRTELNTADATIFNVASGCMGIWVNTNNITVGDWMVGIRDTPNALAFRNEATQQNIYHNRISAAALFNHNNDIEGFTLISRLGNSVYYKRNGTAYQPQGYSYVGVPDESEGIFIGALNNRGSASNYDTNQYAIFNFGGHLSELQAQKLFEADSTLMDLFLNPLLVIVGQSNAAGRGYSDPDSLSAPYVDIIPKSGLILNDDLGDEEFITVLAGSGTSDWAGRFGLEVSYAYESQQNYDTVYIAKDGHGSASISKFFKDSLYYDETLNTINNALAKSGKKSVQFVWYQGEQDWFENSSTYYADLETMFSDILPNINQLVLRKILVELRYDPNGGYLDVLHDQYDYVNDNTDSFLMRTNDLGYDGTGVHLNTQGYIDGGEKLEQRIYINSITY